MCDHGCDCHDPYFDKIYELLQLVAPDCPDIENVQLFLVNDKKFGIRFAIKNKSDFEHIIDLSNFSLMSNKNQIIDKYNKI